MKSIVRYDAQKSSIMAGDGHSMTTERVEWIHNLTVLQVGVTVGHILSAINGGIGANTIERARQGLGYLFEHL
jgi:hypothetical protein